MKKVIPILFALACGMAAQAQVQTYAVQAASINLGEAVPIDPSVRIGRLDNGFSYYLRANKMPENSIQLRLVVNAGSVLEEDSQRGLAHFCEHMAFNGIEGLPHNQMIDTLQKFGIEFGHSINAYTSHDQTVYYLDIPADRPELLDLGFLILDGWSHGLLFDPQELEDERGVIHEEWRRKIDANDRLSRATRPVMYKGSRYADCRPIGEDSVIMGFTRDDIVRFYRDWYRPDLEAVVIVGDIADMDALEARVRETFGRQPKAVDPRLRPKHFKIPDNKKPLVAIATDKEAAGTQVSLMWKLGTARDSTLGDQREGLVRTLAADMLRDRLAELAEYPETPYFTARAYCGGIIGRYNRAFSITAAPKENRAAETAELLLAEVYRAVQHGFTQAELDRQKAAELESSRRLVQYAESMQNNVWADICSYFYLEGGTMPGFQYQDSIQNLFMSGITLDECNEVLRSWVTDENFVFCLMAPDGVAVPTQKQVLKLIKKVRKGTYGAWGDNLVEEPFWGKVLPEAAPVAAQPDTLGIGFTDYTCPNGIHFMVKHTDYNPGRTTFLSRGWGGTSLYEDDEALTVMLCKELFRDAGLGNYNSVQLKRYLKDKDANLFLYFGKPEQGMSGECSVRDLETLLQMISLYYEAPRKDAGYFAKFMDEKRSQYRFASQDPMQVFSQELHSTAYPGDRRKVIIPTAEQLNGITLDRAYEIFRERFHDAGNQTFVFVGDLGDEEVRLIAKYLNSLPADGSQKEEKWKHRPLQFAQGVQHKTVEKGAGKGLVYIYGETQTHGRSTPKEGMAKTQLGYALQITVNEVIRERMGLSYSPRADIWNNCDGDTTFCWSFQIECDPEQEQAAEAAALDIVRVYMANGPDTATLSKVQEQMLVNDAIERQDNNYWMWQILSAVRDTDAESRSNMDVYLNHYEELVRSVTADDVKAAAQKYIRLDNYIVVGLKPEATE